MQLIPKLLPVDLHAPANEHLHALNAAVPGRDVERCVLRARGGAGIVIA